MTDDVCDCGICAVDRCDVCGGPALFIDEDGEAWCRSCWENYQDGQSEAAAEREIEQWHGGSDWMGQDAIRTRIKEGGR